MKRPYEDILDTFFGSLERTRENQIRNFENIDKFMIWVVGFSVGGLSLIVSNISSLYDSYDCLTIKIVLVALAISIIAGIIYRWSFYKFQIEYQKIEFYLQGAFSRNDSVSITARDFSSETDINKIIWFINQDFGKDFSDTLDIYDKEDENGKNFLLEKLKSYHKESTKWAKEEHDAAIKYVDDTFKRAFGISEKQLEKSKMSSTKLFKRYGLLADIGIVISCLSFIVAVLILTILF